MCQTAKIHMLDEDEREAGGTVKMQGLGDSITDQEKRSRAGGENVNFFCLFFLFLFF